MSFHICACLLCCPRLFLTSVLSSLPFMFGVFWWVADFFLWVADFNCPLFLWVFSTCVCACVPLFIFLCFLPFGCLSFVLPSFLSLCGFSFLSEFVVLCLLSLTVCLWLLLWYLLLVFPSFVVVHNFFCLGFCHFVCVYDGVFWWVADFNWRFYDFLPLWSWMIQKIFFAIHLNFYHLLQHVGVISPYFVQKLMKLSQIHHMQE